MKKPFLIWLAVILALANAVFLIWYAYKINHWQTSLYSTPYIVAGIALFFNKPWSKYIYYLLAAWGIGGWLYSVWLSYEAGWPYPDIQRSIISLMPGIFLLITYAGIAWAVRNYFWKQNNA